MNPEVAKILEAISKMVQSEGWQHLKRDFEIRISDLQDEINQVGGNEVKYSENDIKKIEMGILKDIVLYPQNFTDLLTQPKTEEESDPFK